MKKYISDHGNQCWKDVTNDSEFRNDLFHYPDYQAKECDPDGYNVAFHSNIGSITVLDRMTGFTGMDGHGMRDVETGYRDKDGNFWLASGRFDIRDLNPKTVGEAIDLIKKNANNCIPECDPRSQNGSI